MFEDKGLDLSFNVVRACGAYGFCRLFRSKIKNSELIGEFMSNYESKDAQKLIFQEDA